MKQHYALLLLLASILFAAITIFSLCLLEPKRLQKSSFASPSNATGTGRKYGLDAYDALAGLPIRKRSGGSVLPMDSMLARRAADVESDYETDGGEEEETEDEADSLDNQEQTEKEKEKEKKAEEAKKEQDSGVDSSSASSMAILSGLPIRKRTESNVIVVEGHPTAEGRDLTDHRFMRPKVLVHAEDGLDDDLLQAGSSNGSQSDEGSDDPQALVNACQPYRGILCTAGVRYAACMSQEHHNEKRCRLTLERELDGQDGPASSDDEGTYSRGTRSRQHRFTLSTLPYAKDANEHRLLQLSGFAMRVRDHRNALSGTVDVAQAREKAKMLGLMDGFLVDTDYPSPPMAQSSQHGGDPNGTMEGSSAPSLGIVLDQRDQQ